jgi:hypothetical protein
MNTCKKCHIFLHDYLDQALRKNGSLYEVANLKQILENRVILIDAILRAQHTLNDWILNDMKGEVDMRTTFIRKPETKEEEYLLTFFILKQVAPGFRNQMKQIEELVASKEMVKLKRTDKTYGKRDQFLANLFIPLIHQLNEIHNEHCGKPTLKFKSPKDMDNLYD